MVEGTNPTTLAALSAQASPAADARRVSDIELVLLPSTVVGGRIAPNRLNRPVLSSGFSGIAYTSLLKTTTSWKTPLTSMMRSTSWFIPLRASNPLPSCLSFIFRNPILRHISGQEPVKPRES